MNHLWNDAHAREAADNRATVRRALTVPARIMWKDQGGMARMASVVTRNVSDHGVYIECQAGITIPLYRLVQFQVESELRHEETLPEALKGGRVLSAVYRVSATTKNSDPQGFALRLMVDHRRSAEPVESARATA